MFLTSIEVPAYPFAVPSGVDVLVKIRDDKMRCGLCGISPAAWKSLLMSLFVKAASCALECVEMKSFLLI